MKSPRQIPQVGVMPPRQSISSVAAPAVATPSMEPKMPQHPLDTRKQNVMIRAIRHPPGNDGMVW